MTTGIFEIDDDFHREASPESEEEYEITDEVQLAIIIYLVLSDDHRAVSSKFEPFEQNCLVNQKCAQLMSGLFNFSAIYI